MIIAERVNQWVQQRNNDVCDDCIAEALELRRQQANRVTMALGTCSDFERYQGTCSMCGGEKLVVRAVNQH